MEALKVGLVGANQGFAFSGPLVAHGAEIRAVCDLDPDRLRDGGRIQRLGDCEQYTYYEEMLDNGNLDVVVLGTPQHLHAPQASLALERNLHVLSEIPAAVSVEQCQELVRACRQSTGVYMAAENCNYMRSNMVVAELARQGLFGEFYYAEGEYLHDLKALNEITRWRRKWQTGIAGVTYGTHSLGPILQWMAGDRVTRVCCADSACHFQDPCGDYYAQQTPVMLCRTARGALIKIRADMVSDRPHSEINYRLQGTDGAYEAVLTGGIGPGDLCRVWLRELNQIGRAHV